MLRVAEATHATDTGRHRKMNEDRWFARAPLFGVADGMGGAPAGEVASQIAIDVLEPGLPDGPDPAEERLAGLVVDANARIHESSMGDASRTGMGTTMTIAWLGEHELSIAHVGDSRLYCLRGGALERLTRDHSLVEDLVREGRITAQEAENHPQRSIVTRALGAEAHVLTDHFTWRAQDGDIYLVCSDGLTDMVRPEQEVGTIIDRAPSLREAGKALVDAANAAGGRDNITVVLFRVEEIPGTAAAPGGEETMVGRALSASDVREALKEQTPPPGAVTFTPGASRGTPDPPSAEVQRRLPRPPVGKQKKDRTRLASVARTFGFLGIFGLPLLLAAFIASQSVYFVGTNREGFVTLYRGLPYDLPADVSLYTTNFVSGVTTTELPVSVQKTVRSHELRSRNDGEDLVRQVELGTLEGQGGGP